MIVADQAARIRTAWRQAAGVMGSYQRMAEVAAVTMWQPDDGLPDYCVTTTEDGDVVVLPSVARDLVQLGWSPPEGLA